jgi:hypothetical protein
LTKTCNAFAGWNTLANGTGTSYAAGVSITITGPTTLYAKWTAATPPTVSINPSSRNVCPGNNVSVSLTATASGGSGFTYQWFNGSSPVGTSNYYTATSTGTYTCLVTNNAGCTSNGTATIGYYPEMTIATNVDPTPLTTCSGNEVAIIAPVASGGSGTIGRVWHQGTKILVLNTDYYYTKNVVVFTTSFLTEGTHTVYCEFQDANCSKSTASVSITVHPGITITSDIDPTPKTTCYSYDVGVIVPTATAGTGTLTQTWYLDGNRLFEGQNYYFSKNVIVILSNSGYLTAGSHQVWCEFADDYCSKISQTANITVEYCP